MEFKSVNLISLTNLKEIFDVEKKIFQNLVCVFAKKHLILFGLILITNMLIT
jgi:hypothetical protein